jgi:hypothetical protein
LLKTESLSKGAGINYWHICACEESVLRFVKGVGPAHHNIYLSIVQDHTSWNFGKFCQIILIDRPGCIIHLGNRWENKS